MAKFPVVTRTVGNKISGAVDDSTISLTPEDSRFLIGAKEAVAPTQMVNTVAPAITGTAQVGATLTTTNGTWTGSDGVITRQWQKSHGTYQNIPGANATTYVPVVADIGATIRVRVTNLNGAGPRYALSNVTAAVIAA